MKADEAAVVGREAMQVRGHFGTCGADGHPRDCDRCRDRYLAAEERWQAQFAENK